MNTEDTAQDRPVRSLTRSVVVHGSFVLISALLLWLGFWQLNRAHEKREMLELAEESVNAPVLPLAAILGADAKAAAHRYARVTITGVWLPEKQLLWDNRIADGQAGYEVVTPFLTQDGEKVLVNRGWVPVGPSRAVLPKLDAGLDTEAVLSLEAVVTQPSKGLASGPAVEPSDGWPKRLQYLDYDQIGTTIGTEIAPILLQGRRKGEPIVESWQLLSNWEPAQSFAPSRHLGYAVQWFALLITLIFLYFWYELRWFRANNVTTEHE